MKPGADTVLTILTIILMVAVICAFIRGPPI